jgi:hypothetical protein
MKQLESWLELLADALLSLFEDDDDDGDGGDTYNLVPGFG